MGVVVHTTIVHTKPVIHLIIIHLIEIRRIVPHPKQHFKKITWFRPNSFGHVITVVEVLKNIGGISIGIMVGINQIHDSANAYF